MTPLGPKMGPFLCGTWNLSLTITCRAFVWHCVLMAEEASPLSGCIGFWAEEMKHTLLLSVCAIIYFQWSSSALRDQDLQSLPASVQKANVWRTKIKYVPRFFSYGLYIFMEEWSKNIWKHILVFSHTKNPINRNKLFINFKYFQLMIKQ